MKRLIRYCLLALTLLWVGGYSSLSRSGGEAAAQEIQIETTRLQQDAEGRIFRYQDARFKAGALSLDARLIEVDLDRNRVFASGEVHFRNKEIAGTAEKLEINLDDNSVTFFQANLFDTGNGYYLSAEKIVRVNAERYIATECTLTSCTPRKGGWTLEADEVDYRTNDFATGSSAVLRLGPVPVFWFPYLAWPTVRERRSGFLAPEISTESSSKKRLDLGTRLKVPYFLVLGPEHDVTIAPDLIEERGVGLELDYNYAFMARQRGRFRVFRIDEWVSRDRAEEICLTEESCAGSFRPRRQTLDWQHNQGFGEDRRLIMTASQSSDGQVRREYFHLEGFRPQLEYQAAFSAAAGWGDLALTASHGSNFVEESIFADESADADGRFRAKLLPRATYSAGGRPFSALPLGLDFTGRVTNFRSGELVSGRMVEARPSVSYPLNLGGSLELRPTAARRFVQWEGLSQNLPGRSEAELLEELPSHLPSRSFAQSEYEIELRAGFARLFTDGERARSGVKHRIVPRLIYFETEDVAQPHTGSLSLAKAESFLGEPDDLAAGVLPPLYTQRLITLRLDNTWLKGSLSRGGVAAREWIRLDFIQRYNLLAEDEEPFTLGPAPDPTKQETEPGEPLLPAILEGAISGQGVRVAFGLHYHHQLSTFNSKGFSVSAKAAARGKMKISLTENDFAYRTPDNRLIPAGARMKINSEINASDFVSLGFSGSINIRDTPAPLGRRLETGKIFVNYNPGCYALKVTFLEAISFSRVSGGEPEYFLDRRLVFTLDIGGLIEARTTQELSGGG